MPPTPPVVHQVGEEPAASSHLAFLTWWWTSPAHSAPTAAEYASGLQWLLGYQVAVTVCAVFMVMTFWSQYKCVLPGGRLYMWSWSQYKWRSPCVRYSWS